MLETENAVLSGRAFSVKKLKRKSNSLCIRLETYISSIRNLMGLHDLANVLRGYGMVKLPSLVSQSWLSSKTDSKVWGYISALLHKDRIDTGSYFVFFHSFLSQKIWNA